MKAFILLATVCASLASVSTQAESPNSDGALLFSKHCGACHGSEGQGSDPWYPNLREASGKHTTHDLAELILTGQFRRGGDLNGHPIPVMPSWHSLKDREIAQLVNYIKNTWGDASATTLAPKDVNRLRNSSNNG